MLFSEGLFEINDNWSQVAAEEASAMKYDIDLLSGQKNVSKNTPLTRILTHITWGMN